MAPTGAAREKFYFQFITTPTSDTPGTSLLLHFDNKRYLFGNISEGTQRACIQRGIALRKVRNIFLTGTVKWGNTGGLIGMILTLADTQAAEREAEKLRSINPGPRMDSPREVRASTEQARPLGEETLVIHGGEKILHTLACARRFVFRKGMPVSINEFEFAKDSNLEKPTWEDENIQVWAMPIAPSTSNGPDNGDLESSEEVASSPEARLSSNSRKRSHDQSEQGADESSGPTSPGQHLRDRELRRKIVSDMFNSQWNRDALFETPLAQVKMPAALFVRDPETKTITSYRGPKPGGDEPLPDINVLVRNPWPGAMIEDLPPARDLDFKPAVSYIVQGFPQRGKFDPKKAVELGVPKGPQYSALVAGKSVTLANGTIVTPDMVLGPRKPGRGIAIVDLPTNRYVDNLINRPEWTFEHIKDGITAICWVLGPTLASHPALRDFMRSLPNVEHIISSTDVCPNYLALDSSASSAIRLSRISNKHFPVPVHDNVTLPQIGTGIPRTAKSSAHFTAANRGLGIQIEPKFLMMTEDIPPLLNTAVVVNKIPSKVQELARLARKEVLAAIDPAVASDSVSYDEASKFDPQVITLGTGSALPSKYRNVSATLLRTEKYGNFLFDCGENTLGQLKRIFDPAALLDVLKNLRFIWISHLHADHHLGTVSVLAATKGIFSTTTQGSGVRGIGEVDTPRERVVVASESKMLQFLEEYGGLESLPKIRRLFCQPFQGPILDEEMANFLHEQLGIKDLQTTAVDHCSGAQAISITFENGFKFSYSGDCRPSVPFATIGKGSDVLVHEATFDDDMEGDALAKKHCTTAEALGVAAKMEAKNVILTHFSQRYQKLPVMEHMKIPISGEVSAKTSTEHLPAFLGELGEAGAADEDTSTTSNQNLVIERKTLLEMAGLDASVSEAPKLDMNICVAFDYMSVRVSDIKHMQKFTPALATLFEAEQTKSIDGNATPQEKCNEINRAKGSKKPQGSKDVDSNGSLTAGIEGKPSEPQRLPEGEQTGSED
jgi:ribonuclease Z